MGLKKVSVLECDRCGRSLTLESDTTAFDIGYERGAGWKRLSGDRFLCPQCKEGYELIEARHVDELERYVNELKLVKE